MEIGWFELGFDVQDMARTRGFYELLGFVVADVAFDGRVVVMQKAGCRICLYQGFLDPPETQLIFWQGDVEAVAAALTAKGFVFERPPVRGADGAIGALIRDPDGRPIYFVNLPGVVRSG